MLHSYRPEGLFISDGNDKSGWGNGQDRWGIFSQGFVFSQVPGGYRIRPYGKIQKAKVERIEKRITSLVFKEKGSSYKDFRKQVTNLEENKQKVHELKKSTLLQKEQNDLSPEEMKKKKERNLLMLYKNLENAPDDAYTCFQIAQSEFIIGEYEKAVYFYE